MVRLSLPEFIYYGLILVTLGLYLSLYIKNRGSIIPARRTATRWGIVASFAVIGVLGVLFGLVGWLHALLSAGLACAIAYYVIFIKYADK